MRKFKVTLGGKEYTATSLTMGDLEDLQNWARQQTIDRITAAVNSTNGLFTEEEKKTTVKDAVHRVMRLGLDSSELTSKMHSVEGMRQLIYHCLKRENSVTLDDLQRMDIEISELSEFAEVLEQLMSTGIAIKGSGAKKKKKAPR